MAEPIDWERRALRAYDEIMELRYALRYSRCFAGLPGGGRCTRRAWLARDRRPVCNQHGRAKTVRYFDDLSGRS